MGAGAASTGTSMDARFQSTKETPAKMAKRRNFFTASILPKRGGAIQAKAWNT
jgi:hypothetical protein